MIRLTDVSKGYPTHRGMHLVLNELTCEIEQGNNLGILGQNGAGKSTLLRILAGIEQPDAGVIERQGKLSWPIGFAGGFNGSLSGEENCHFVARIYGRDIHEVVDFARDFAELGDYFFMPVRTYSSGMKARLAFGLSMAIDFDYYLVDEVTAVGDKRFQNRCRDAFQARSDHSTVIIVSHQLNTIKQYCTSVAALENGKLRFFESVEEATRIYGA